MTGSIDARRGARVAAVGVSIDAVCGVRDYAHALAEALGGQGVCCSTHWLDRSEPSLRGAHAEVRAWTRDLGAELSGERPDAALLHYSVFSYAYRGLPLFVRPVLSELRRARLPLLTVLHEFAYPWGRAGVHGAAWALSQRALLVEVMRSCAAGLVTIQERADWLGSRVWLARRPLAFAPVPSNLPPPSVLQPTVRTPPTVGLFGYAHEGSAVALVLDALRLAQQRGLHTQLTLLGAPGRSSRAGERWLAGARALALSPEPSFSGTLPGQELSDALAACQALLFADSAGPSSRKTTLAAVLGSGRPVLAIDGPLRWQEPIDAGALRLVAPTAEALADGLQALLQDEQQSQELGRRGRAFAETRMSPARAARALTGLLDEILPPLTRQ